MSTPPTSTRSFTFLVNPAAGGGAAPGAVVPVARALREAGARVDVTYSPAASSVGALVAEAVGRDDVVVSVGGDGMLSSLAGPVTAAGGTLAVLPAGRGNDFARMLDLPATPAAQAERLLRGPVRRVDLVDLVLPGGRSHTVVGSVYAGVDARAAEIVDRSRRLPTRLQYPWAALAALATYVPGRFRLDVDGVGAEYAAACVVLANSAFYGKGMRVAPDAQVDDGLLDVVVVEAASKVALVRALPSIYSGAHVHRPEVTVLRGARVEVGVDSARPVPLGGDGEPLGVLPGLGEAPAVVSVRAGALAVVA